MAARFGTVIYLACCGVALAWIVILLSVRPGGLFAPANAFDMFVIIPALLVFGFGVACLYVLKGDVEVDVFPPIAPSHVSPPLVFSAIAVVVETFWPDLFTLDFWRHILRFIEHDVLGSRPGMLLLGVFFYACAVVIVNFLIWHANWRGLVLREKLTLGGQGAFGVLLLGGLGTAAVRDDILAIAPGPHQYVFSLVALVNCFVLAWGLEQSPHWRRRFELTPKERAALECRPNGEG